MSKKRKSFYFFFIISLFKFKWHTVWPSAAGRPLWLHLQAQSSVPDFKKLLVLLWPTMYLCLYVHFVQASIVTVCARRVAGDPTAPTAAPVRTEAPAPQRMALVCVLQATGAPTADEVKDEFSHPHFCMHVLTVLPQSQLQWCKKCWLFTLYNGI